MLKRVRLYLIILVLDYLRFWKKKLLNDIFCLFVWFFFIMRYIGIYLYVR
jgi:hypothetical protein